MGKRSFPFARELWIEREDFMESPPKGYFRLYPGNMVRLRYGYVVKCTGCDKDAAGNVTAVHCEYLPDSRSGTPGVGPVQGEGQHPLGEREARVRGGSAALRPAVRGALSRVAQGTGRGAVPGRAEQAHDVVTDDETAQGPTPRRTTTGCDDLNPDSKKVITAYLEPGLKDAKPEDRFQFERHGYFVADLRDSKPGKPVFNRAVTLRDSWAKQAGLSQGAGADARRRLRRIAGAASVLELAVLADHGQFDERRSVVIAGREVNIESADIDVPHRFQRRDQLVPGEILAGAPGLRP